jgi:hypothetical protein
MRFSISNRQSSKLESPVSHTKQGLRHFLIANFGASLALQPPLLPAGLDPLALDHCFSNRQTPPELEMPLTYTKQTPGLISNRQWNAFFSACFESLLIREGLQ